MQPSETRLKGLKLQDIRPGLSQVVREFVDVAIVSSIPGPCIAGLDSVEAGL